MHQPNAKRERERVWEGRYIQLLCVTSLLLFWCSQMRNWFFSNFQTWLYNLKQRLSTTKPMTFQYVEANGIWHWSLQIFSISKLARGSFRLHAHPLRDSASRGVALARPVSSPDAAQSSRKRGHILLAILLWIAYRTHIFHNTHTAIFKISQCNEIAQVILGKRFDNILNQSEQTGLGHGGRMQRDDTGFYLGWCHWSWEHIFYTENKQARQLRSTQWFSHNSQNLRSEQTEMLITKYQARRLLGDSSPN